MMVQYVDNGDVAVFNNMTFRRDKRTNYYLSSRLMGDKRKRLHVAVWEYYNGDVPDGYDVHHKEQDKLKNDIDDLELLESKAHKKWHDENIPQERLEKVRKNLAEKARPKASEWHKSEAGRKWHSEQSKKAWENKSNELRHGKKERIKSSTFQCDMCNKEFISLKDYNAGQNKFCSNKCKSAFRRKSGLDNIVKICEHCGNEYISSKYMTRKYCSRECSYVGRRK